MHSAVPSYRHIRPVFSQTSEELNDDEQYFNLDLHDCGMLVMELVAVSHRDDDLHLPGDEPADVSETAMLASDNTFQFVPHGWRGLSMIVFC